MKLSIIVVTWNNENFIEQALKSCIFSSSYDYEVIVVHNASTDRTGSLISRAIRGHENIFKVIENTVNVGLGEGRNIGLNHATGEYILFLDGDDWFAPETLDVLYKFTLSAEHDVVMFNHARFYENGRVSKNSQTNILYEGTRNTPQLRKEILSNFGVAWNKLYKLSSIKENNAKFGEGFYEDIDWHFHVMLLSKSIYVIPNILILYRQRVGSITRSTDPRHFDMLAQYKNVIKLLVEHSLTSEYGDAVYKYGRGQLLNVLNASDRLPAGTKAEYLSETANLLEDFRKTAEISPAAFVDKLVGLNNLTIYNYGTKLNIWRHHLIKSSKKKYKTAKSKALKGLRSIVYKNLYQKLPLQEKTVLFESFWGNKMDCNPWAISKMLTEYGYNCLWAMHPNAASHPEFTGQRIKKYSLAYYKALATAKYLVSNANFPDIWQKRNGQIHLQTFHGTPLKYMGLDIIKTNPKEMNWDRYAIRTQKWDFALSSNEHSSAAWRGNAPYAYKILETGYPRNDILAQKDPEQMAAIRASLGIPAGKKVALYAPTFREKQKNSTIDLQDTEQFNAIEVKRALGDEYVLLLRGHYFTSTNEKSTDQIIDVSTHHSTNEICLIADLLITDYSSIMFDYACLGRPIILHIHDYDDYVKTRGTYFDIRDKSPGLISKNMAELTSILSSREFESPLSMSRIQSFHKEFCDWDDGNATKRVLAEVFNIKNS